MCYGENTIFVVSWLNLTILAEAVMSEQSGDVLNFFDEKKPTPESKVLGTLAIVIVGCFEATKQYADEAAKAIQGQSVQLEIYHVSTYVVGKQIEDEHLRQQIQKWISHLNSQNYIKIVSLVTTNGFCFVSERSKIDHRKRLWERNWHRAKMPAELLAKLQGICVKEQHQASA